MKYKLNVKLILSYLFIAFFLVGILAIVTNITFKNQFKEYVINIQKEKQKNVVDSILNDYKNNKMWSNVNFEEIGMNSLEDGLIIKISDNKNIVLWDAMEHNSGMCAQMLAEMANNMKKYYPDFVGKYTDKEYILKVDNIVIGKVLIAYYGPYYYSESEIAFLKTFNNVLLIISVISMLLSICLGVIISKRITSNITSVIKTTKEISAGNYKYRINQKSDIKEIIDLTDAVNKLAITLDKQEQLRKDLTSDIAHELRTPITTLQGHLEAIKDGVWKLTPDKVESLYEETIRISKIVNDLDKLNNYDNNNIILNKTEFSIRTILLKIIKNFEVLSKEKNIIINITGHDQKIIADEDKIAQIFINLVSNSLKYTNSGGYIDIIITATKNNIKIIVKDNGIGILENELPFIFERFYRTDKSRARSTGGSGIGLSIVKKIVDAHNGSISVSSKINQGTTVEVTLLKKTI